MVHGTMNCANNPQMNPGVGANETVVLLSIALQPYRTPRPVDARRVVFAVTVSHEAVSYGGFHADWTYIRKLFSVYVFLGGRREPICMLAYSFPFTPGEGGWEDFRDGFGERVNRDGWGAHDGLHIDIDNVAAVEDALDLDPESDDIGVVLRCVMLVADARANGAGQWNALEAFHATGGDRAMIKEGHWPDGSSDDRIPFGDDDDLRLIHTCGDAAVRAYPFVEGDVDADVRTSPLGLLDATKTVLADRLADAATTNNYTALARALTGYRAAVEALVPAPDHWRAARAGAPGYWDNTPKTVAEATACNQDALRWHGVPEGVWPTDADGRFGLWGGRDFRESDSEPEESDSDDSE